MKTYSKILYASATALLVLSACGNHKSDSYTIDVNITGLPDSTKVLLRPVTHNREAESIGEAYIVDGKAQFTGSVEGPTGAYFRVENGNGWLPFMIENSKITISGNMTATPSERDPRYINYDFSELAVTGSETTPRFQGILAKKDSIFEVMNNNCIKYAPLIEKYGKARRDKNKAVLDSIEATEDFKVYTKFEETSHFMIDSVFTAAVSEGNDSFWGPMAMLSLYVYFVPDMRPMYEAFSDEAKESVYGQEVKKELYPVGRPGDKLDNFETINTTGDSVSMEEIARNHKYTLIDFWASWCGPCRREIPNLRKIYDQHKDNGFNILSVSIDQEDDAWRKALDEEKLPWINCRDTEGDIAKAYGVRSIPMLVVVDSEGRLVIENLRGEELANKLTELLNK